MKLRKDMRSTNVVDRRGRGPGRAIAGGGGLIVVALLVAQLFFPEAVPILEMLAGGQNTQASRQAAPVKDETNEFVTVTLAYTEDFWSDAFQSGAFPAAGSRYKEPKLVLFSGRDASRCGPALAQTGPFYCPADNSIYIDPSFYQVMARQLKAPGDFAQAYVIAHEVAHHVQNLNGVLRQVHQAKIASGDKLHGNRLTVRVELQADCYSGVWARRTDEKLDILEAGDLNEALRAAYQVGDDVMMRMGGQRVDETQFTHGSAKQRARWFRRGFESGDLAACDTFRQSYESL